MGGQGSKDLPTTGRVGLSLRVGHRKIRGRDPRGYDEAIACRSDWWDLQEKPLSIKIQGVRTKTDTGR